MLELGWPLLCFCILRLNLLSLLLVSLRFSPWRRWCHFDRHIYISLHLEQLFDILARIIKFFKYLLLRKWLLTNLNWFIGLLFVKIILSKSFSLNYLVFHTFLHWKSQISFAIKLLLSLRLVSFVCWDFRDIRFVFAMFLVNFYFCYFFAIVSAISSL